jgi:hypothetical protein
MNFKLFLMEAGTFDTDLKESLKKLPKKHQNLVKGYKFKSHPENTIKGDKGACGLIDEKKKEITVAAPWNYGREYTFLHEIGHLVWKYLMSEDKREQWGKLAEKIKSKNKKNSSLNQIDEELFCMGYAAAYCNQPVVAFDHDSWIDFIKKI